MVDEAIVSWVDSVVRGFESFDCQEEEKRRSMIRD